MLNALEIELVMSQSGWEEVGPRQASWTFPVGLLVEIQTLFKSQRCMVPRIVGVW